MCVYCSTENETQVWVLVYGVCTVALKVNHKLDWFPVCVRTVALKMKHRSNWFLVCMCSVALKMNQKSDWFLVCVGTVALKMQKSDLVSSMYVL